MGMKLFGRNYNDIGDIDSDFCIRTRGQVKIQYGKKFIDLIKDGKINADVDFIFKVKDKDGIKGKDGIYLVGNEDLYIKVGDLIIPIVGAEAGSDYVSYSEEQNKDIEEKQQAQKNIGIAFDTLQEFIDSGMKSGAAFIIDEGKFYIMKNGEPQEMMADLPDPYPKPLWIQIGNQNNKPYALFIDGYMSANGSCVIIGSTDNGMKLYSELNNSFIDCSGALTIKINSGEVIKISRELISMNSNLEMGVDKYISANTVKSNGATTEKGFMLDMDDQGYSHLYIDEIHVRAKIDNSIHVTYEELVGLIKNESLEPNISYCIDDFHNEWDIVENIDEDQYNEEGDLIRRRNVLPLVVTARTNKALGEYAYYLDYPQWKMIYDYEYNDVLCQIEDYEIKAKGRIKRMEDEYGNKAPYDFKNLRFKIDGEWRYTFGDTVDKSLDGTFFDNDIQGYFDKIEKRCVENELNIEYCINEGMGLVSINGKEVHNNTVGVILGKFFFDNSDAGIFKDNKLYAEELGEVNIKGDFISNNFTCDKILKTDFPKGAYSVYVNGGFENCKFEDKQLIHDYFHSSFKDIQFSGDKFFDKLYSDKVADVYMNDGKLRVICIPDFCWPGMITMYNGQWDLPECWAVCDGSNGTPDLTGCFIRANTSFGPANPDEYMDYPFEINSGNVPLPNHTHPYTYEECNCPPQGAKSIGDTKVMGISNGIVSMSARVSSNTGGVNEGGLVSRKLIIKLPKFYDLIFIMYIGR